MQTYVCYHEVTKSCAKMEVEGCELERWFVKKRKRQGEHDISHGDNLKQSPSQGKTATQAWHLIKHCKLRLQYSLMENQPRYLEATARLRVTMPTARRMQTAITAGDGTSSAAGFVAGRQPSSPRHTARNAGPMTVRSTRAAAARDRRGRTTSHFPKASSRLVASQDRGQRVYQGGVGLRGNGTRPWRWRLR